MNARVAPLNQHQSIPLWLVVATAVMALLILLLAVAETSITVAWLVDTRGEFLSLFGLAFISLLWFLFVRHLRDEPGVVQVRFSEEGNPERR